MDHAKHLRQSSTDAEALLWQRLRNAQLGVKFRRQHRMAGYILDFACLERWLIVEADGGQHADSRSDLKRDSYLEHLGFRVLRFWNNEVLENASGVFEMIYTALHTPHPPTAAQRVPPSPVPGEGLGELNG